MSMNFETTLKRWPLFDDRQHWKVYSSTGHWNFFPAEDEKQLKNRIAEFQMDVRAAMGEPIDRELALKEAEQLIGTATDFTTQDLFREHPL